MKKRSANALPEMDGDLKWRRILNDGRPRPALSALGNEVELQFACLCRQPRRPKPPSPHGSAGEGEGDGED